jgi:hypothetical protein
MNLGLPSWDKLVSQIGEQLDYDPEIFKTFGDYLALAEYYKIEKGSLGELRSWMDKTWHSPNIKIEDSEIHKYIVEGKFPIIYTTNYDNWLELAFKHYDKEFIKITKASDITKIKENITQIIKFHGDFSDDNSLVLTESSYFDRLDFESPLDIKLRSDILGKTVLFAGYSLTDINIRYLFYKLAKLWKKYDGTGGRPESYLFMTRPNPIQEKVLKKWGITLLSSELDDHKNALLDFLKKLAE